MNTFFILCLVVAVAVAIYFLFFNEKKQLYPENKISKTFESINELLLPHEDDHHFVKRRKDRLITDLKEVKKIYSRSPSAYTKEEISDFEKLLPEVKEDLRNFCDSLIELKPPIVSIIKSQREMIKAAEEAALSAEEVSDGSEDDENVMDTLEKILETAPLTIREKEEELLKLEKSIARYKSL